MGAQGQDPMPLQLLADYVTGSLGGESDAVARQIARLVVVGNLIKETGEVPMTGMDKREAKRSVSSLKEADLFLTQVASSMPIDIMPGPNDPCNVSLPQQVREILFTLLRLSDPN